jgi:hypothetical protein
VVQGNNDLLAVKDLFKAGFLPGLEQLPGSAIVSQKQRDLNLYLLPGGYFRETRGSSQRAIEEIHLFISQ